MADRPEHIFKERKRLYIKLNDLRNIRLKKGITEESPLEKGIGKRIEELDGVIVRYAVARSKGIDAREKREARKKRQEMEAIEKKERKRRP